MPLKHYTDIAELPEDVPVFPLAGALLLPRTDLPLNIFEPRYLAMFNDAMAGQRLIGMIQPRDNTQSDTPPVLASVGCVGRITSFSETDDGRLLVNLMGVCRFVAGEELQVKTPYRRIRVDFLPFRGDLRGEGGAMRVNRDAVMRAFRQYLEANEMTANWDEVAQISTEALINTLSQLAPYPANEKQALLEAADLKERADMLIALTELALARSGNGNGRQLQ